MLKLFQKFFISHLMFHSIKEPFHQFSKLADDTPILKKGSKSSKDNYRPIKICQICQKYLQNIMYNRWLPSCINTFPNFNVALEKAIAHGNVSFH